MFARAGETVFLAKLGKNEKTLLSLARIVIVFESWGN